MGLHQLLADYAKSRRTIPVNFRQLVPELRYGDQLSHFIHPYPGKLLPHIPHFFLNARTLMPQGGRVLDPFCGSGTVLLEALLSGHSVTGTDTNPLACLISKVKTTPLASDLIDLEMRKLSRRFQRQKDCKPPVVINLHYWYHPHVIEQLAKLREALSGVTRPVVRDFLNVAFSAVARRVSLADPRLSVPVRSSADKYPAHHHLHLKTVRRLKHLRTIDVWSEFSGLVHKNSERIGSLATVATDASVEVFQVDARELPLSGEGDRTPAMADLIVTSPPYIGSQKYIRATSLSLGWLGYGAAPELRVYDSQTLGREKFRKVDVSSPKKIGISRADRLIKTIHHSNPLRACIAATYLEEIRDAVAAMRRSLRSGGHLVIVIGNSRICGREFPTTDFIADIAEALRLRIRLRLVDDIHSRGLMTKRNSTAGVISQESVLVFEKL